MTMTMNMTPTGCTKFDEFTGWVVFVALCWFVVASLTANAERVNEQLFIAEKAKLKNKFEEETKRLSERAKNERKSNRTN